MQTTDIAEYELREPTKRHILSKTDKSAYITLTMSNLIALAAACILAAGANAIFGKIPLVAFGAVLIFGITRFAYQFTLLRVRVLYLDDRGLWMKEGILPWRKGIYGLEWRDFGDVSFHNDGIWNWIFKTGTIAAFNRYKNGYSLHFHFTQNPNEVAGEIRKARDKYCKA